MKKQNGFTLIELVIVIIVLGILAATAVPKFINLQDDAKESAMNGVQAAVHSAANIVYSKSAIDGHETKATETVAEGDVNIATVYGYPAATETGIEDAVELSGFVSKYPESAGLNISFVSEKDDATGDLCLLYTAATDNTVYSLAKGKLSTTACDTSSPNGNW